MANSIIKNFNQISSDDVKIAGGKGASLGELTKTGIPVPDGFVILSDAFDRFLAETDLNIEIESILSKVDIKKIHTIENASEKIQALILGQAMPDDIRFEVFKYHKKLKSAYVAVRSSATAEDSVSLAWAGQLDSFLNTTEKNLLENMKKCWASLFTPRAIFYRFENKLDQTKISVAVVVQKMIQAEKSGIAFSVHPVTQDYNQAIIEAGFGLGEAIVSGAITPDSYVVNKKNLSIIDININEQKRALFLKPNGGNQWKSLGTQGKKQVLSNNEIIELSKLVLKIEKHYGFPCDIEWAQEKGKFFIVQSRPITTLLGLKNQKDLNIIEKYKESLKDGEKFTFSGPLSNLFTAIPWSNDKYYSKYYQTPSFSFLFIGNRRNNSETIDNDKYRKYSKEMFEKFLNKKISIKNLKNIFNSRIKKAEKIYFSEIIEPKKSFLKAFDELLHLVSATVYIEMLDKTIVEEVMGYAISDCFWEMAISPTFESFDIRWLKKAKQANSIKEIEYIFTDYYFIKSQDEIAKRIKLKKKELFPTKEKKHKISSNKDWVKYVQFVMETRDLRKDAIAQLYTIMAKCAQKIYPNATNDQLANLNALEVFYDNLPSLKELQKRIDNKYVMLIRPDLTYEISYDYVDEAEKYIKQISNVKIDEIHGVSACKGVVTGLVRKIIDPEESLTFNQGDILLTSMTRPDFIPLMKKAGAVITNEGGITCHAAIISRELNIPCIIGTKNATLLLSDGDLVTVNANQGVVIILSKNNSSQIHQKELIVKESFSKQISCSFMPVICFESAVRAYVNNPFLKKLEIKSFPRVVQILTDKFESWDDQNIQKITDNKEVNFLIKSSREVVKNNYFEINTLLKTDLSILSTTDLIKSIKSIDKICREVYFSYLFFIHEYFETTDKNLLILLPEVRMELSDFVSHIYQCCDNLINSLSQKYPTLPWQTFTYATFEEIVGLLKNKKSVKEFKRINGRAIAFVLENNKVLTITDKKKILNIKKQLAVKNNIDHDKTIKGNSVFPGVAKGRVIKITVADYSSISKILKNKKNYILVTPMTRPEFVPFLKNAKAIVTDEGGLTCHAAIVARELKKPCVVGTRNATEGLNNGDLVEVNAHTGIIKIIKKK